MLEIHCIDSSYCILVEAGSIVGFYTSRRPGFTTSESLPSCVHNISTHIRSPEFLLAHKYGLASQSWPNCYYLLITYNFYFLLCLASVCPASTAPEAILPRVLRSCTYTTRSNFAFFSSECYNNISIGLIPSDFRRKIWKQSAHLVYVRARRALLCPSFFSADYEHTISFARGT